MNCVATSSIQSEFSLALVAFVLLVIWRQPAWRVVLFCAGLGHLNRSGWDPLL